jgi:NTP pyrophosphatase (non-canonical NTP hydrolase)
MTENTPPYGAALKVLETEILMSEPSRDDSEAAVAALKIHQRQLTDAHTFLKDAQVGGFGALVSLVRQWGEDKGITGPHAKATPQTQFDKLLEEVDETRRAIEAGDKVESKDGVGDCTVVLILLSELLGFRFEEALQAAYDIINKRTGKMVDGKFLKDS